MKNYILVDLGYGDSGKGSFTDHLVRKLHAQTVVRYNGGCQCAHNVWTDKQHHTFRQFGSGTIAGAHTVIGPEVVVNPLTMVREANELQDKRIVDVQTSALSLVTVAQEALIVTPYHRALCCIREYMRGSKHGSTGMGIGECRRISLLSQNNDLVIRVKDCHVLEHSITEAKLDKLRQALQQEADEILLNAKHCDLVALAPETMWLAELTCNPYKPSRLVEAYNNWYASVNVSSTYDIKQQLELEAYPVVFEGAQGLLLDKQHGFHPYTTWSDTTPRQAFQLLNDRSDTEVIGLSRTYTTRHGLGPMVTEGQLNRDILIDDDNPTGQFTGQMRIGCLDLEALKYSLKVCQTVGCPVDKLAFSHVDKLADTSSWPVCTAYINPDVYLCEYNCTEEASKEAQQLTTKLLMAKPFISHYSSYRVLDDICGELETPIAIKSYGKTHQHKIKLC